MRKRKYFISHKRPLHPARSYFDISSLDPLPVYEQFVEDLRQSHDEWAWGCCPFHDDNNPSFSVNLSSGYFRCMSSSCGMKGSLVGFVRAILNLDTRDAIRYLEENHG